mgnify:CR=1 FL=1
MNKIKYLVLIPVVLLLSACASDSKKVVDLRVKYVDAATTPIKTTNKYAQSQLAEASTQTSKSLNDLSAMNKALHPKIKLAKPLNPKLIHMTEPTSIDWNGPLLPLLKKVAAASNYKVHIVGKRNGIPIMITINKKDVPLAEIFRDIKYQAEPNATIVVYPGNKTMELRYHNS